MLLFCDSKSLNPGSVVAVCVITIMLMVAAGAKLQSVLVHLAARAQFLYGEESIAEHAAISIHSQDASNKDSDVTDQKQIEAQQRHLTPPICGKTDRIKVGGSEHRSLCVHKSCATAISHSRSLHN